MKYYTILENNKIIELDKVELKDLKEGLTRQEALDLAKKHNLRLPFIFEVAQDIDSNEKLKQILIDGWIWTGELYNGNLSGLGLGGDLGLHSTWCDLAGSLCFGRVVFVEDKAIREDEQKIRADEQERIIKIIEDRIIICAMAKDFAIKEDNPDMRSLVEAQINMLEELLKTIRGGV